MKNRTIRRAELSESRFCRLLRCFCLDFDAEQIEAMIRVNRNTVNRYLRLIRQRISSLCEESAPFGNSSVFEARLAGFRISFPSDKRKLSQAAPPIFGVMEKDGHVFSEILPQPVQAVVKSALNRKTPLGDTAHILRFRGYSVLMYFGCEKPYFLRNGRPFSPVSSMDHATPLWLYWLYAGKRLSKFQGISRGTFGLHLKECEFRFNTRGKDIYTMLLGEFRRRPVELEDDNQDADRQQNTLKSHYWDLVKGEVGFTYRDFPEEALRGLPEA